MSDSNLWNCHMNLAADQTWTFVAFPWKDLPGMKQMRFSNVPLALIVKPWIPSTLYSSINFETVSASNCLLRFQRLKMVEMFRIMYCNCVYNFLSVVNNRPSTQFTFAKILYVFTSYRHYGESTQVIFCSARCERVGLLRIFTLALVIPLIRTHPKWKIAPKNRPCVLSLAIYAAICIAIFSFRWMWLSGLVRNV